MDYRGTFRTLALLLAAILFPSLAAAQGTVVGQERPLTFTGNTASIAPPNTPVSNFLSPLGTNTFILPLSNPTTGIRLYITNNTAIACPSTFTVQMFAASDAQVTSFNNSLANWQTVPLQDASGSLVPISTLNIPASGVAYVTSTAFSSPKAAVQIVNTNAGNCSGTTVEITASIVQISVTAPLVSANNNAGGNTATANQVQGIVGPGLNGAAVNPVVVSGLGIPVNNGFNTLGIDTFQSANIVIGNGAAGTFTRFTTFAPSKSGEFLLMYMDGGQDTSSSFVAANSPFICQNSSGALQSPGGCSTTGGGRSGWIMYPNVVGNVPFNHQYANANSTQNNSEAIVYLANTPVISMLQSPTTTAGPVNLGTVVAGATVFMGLSCGASVAPCIATVTDNQSGTWKKLTGFAAGGFTNIGVELWARTSVTSNANLTVSWTLTAGAANPTESLLLLTGLNASPLNQPSVGVSADALGNQTTLTDAFGINEFALSTSISTATTTQIVPAPTTINGVPVRAYVTDFQIQTTATGAGSTLQFVTGTGTNCATTNTALSAILYSNATVGINSFVGPRTPLVAPLQSAVCVVQVGATPGTAVVELRGFYAP